MHSHHLHTPFLVSAPLSKRMKKPVYLKIDALQPSGSFKDRGMGRLLAWHIRQGNNTFVASSGGNAGIAAATVANAMGAACKVFVPESTAKISVEKMKLQNAQVILHIHFYNAN